MKRTTIYVAAGAVAGAIAFAFGGLMAATRGDAPVMATVTENLSLPRLDVNDVTLHGEITGPDGAPLVIVLHGGPGGDHRSLKGLAALSDRYRVLFFDQRGSGLSERVSETGLGVSDYLADIEALAEAHAPGQEVILVGHSFGAMLALAFMGQQPERVRGAVLIEPGFLDAAGYAAWEQRRREIAGSGSVTLTGLLAGFQARNVTARDGAAQRDFIVGSVVHAFADHPANPYHCPGEAYSAPSWRFGGAASDTFWADPTPLFSAIEPGIGTETPLLFLAGGCNDWTGAPLQEAHAARFPKAELITIEGAGHDVIWDQKDAAIRAIRRYLQEL
jgi:proline iminopeptidase